VDEGLDGQVEADEEENPIRPAHQHREPSIEAPIEEAAVNVKRVQTVLRRKKSCHHALMPI
jgi:hypothetical protein